jgi:hypothetical protein
MTEVKETTDTASSASFLDLYLEFDDSGQLSTKIYDKRDDLSFYNVLYNNAVRLVICNGCHFITFYIITLYAWLYVTVVIL